MGWRGQSWVGLGKGPVGDGKDFGFTLSETEATGACKAKGDTI